VTATLLSCDDAYFLVNAALSAAVAVRDGVLARASMPVIDRCRRRLAALAWNRAVGICGGRPYRRTALVAVCGVVRHESHSCGLCCHRLDMVLLAVPGGWPLRGPRLFFIASSRASGVRTKTARGKNALRLLGRKIAIPNDVNKRGYPICPSYPSFAVNRAVRCTGTTRDGVSAGAAASSRVSAYPSPDQRRS